MATTLFSVKVDSREWEKGGAETKSDATVVILQNLMINGQEQGREGEGGTTYCDLMLELSYDDQGHPLQCESRR